MPYVLLLGHLQRAGRQLLWYRGLDTLMSSGPGVLHCSSSWQARIVDYELCGSWIFFGSRRCKRRKPEPGSWLARAQLPFFRVRGIYIPGTHSPWLFWVEEKQMIWGKMKKQ
jgi:hypothetical protein